MSQIVCKQDEIQIDTSELGYIVLSQESNEIWIHRDYVNSLILAINAEVIENN